MAVDRILGRLGSLIDMGATVLRAPVGEMGYYVDTGLFQQWRTSSLAFLRATLGTDSVHYQEFEERCKHSQRSQTTLGLGTLRAAKEDIEGGYLQRVEVLVSASVFSDFLEMAERLLDNGYKDPTASLIGADLEKYGPFKTEDIATIPYENAQALIAKNIATKVHWED